MHTHRRLFRLSSRPSGFTLIELLVVIAIIAILAAVLFPVFAQAREKARQSACLSNMKQIGTGLMMYAQDYDETFPGNSAPAVATSAPKGFMQPPSGSNTDFNTLNIVPRDMQPYVKNLEIFHCPSSTDRTDSPGYANPVSNGANTSYMYNGIVMFRPLSVIPNPADIIFLHEEPQNMCYVQERPWFAGGSFRNLPARANGIYYMFNYSTWDMMHQGGANLLFCDGHTHWEKKNAIRFTQFGALAGTGANKVNPADRTLSIDATAANNETNLTFLSAF